MWKPLKSQEREEAYFFLDLFAYFFHHGKNVGQGLRDEIPSRKMNCVVSNKLNFKLIIKLFADEIYMPGGI
jgi:hypothetical protein